MKAFAAALLFVAAAYAAPRDILEVGPACPYDPEIISESGYLNVSFPPIIEIFEGAVREILTTKGLDTLKYEYSINLITLEFKVDLTLGSVEIDTSAYSGVTGYIDARPLRQETLPSGNFTGEGKASLKATNIHLQASGNLFVNLISDKVSVRVLTVQTLTFDSLSADLGQKYLIVGKPVDWASWSQTFKANFDADFAKDKVEIVDKVRVSANVVLGKYTLQELIDLIGNVGGDRCTTTARS